MTVLTAEATARVRSFEHMLNPRGGFWVKDDGSTIPVNERTGHCDAGWDYLSDNAILGNENVYDTLYGMGWVRISNCGMLAVTFNGKTVSPLALYSAVHLFRSLKYAEDCTLDFMIHGMGVEDIQYKWSPDGTPRYRKVVQEDIEKGHQTWCSKLCAILMKDAMKFSKEREEAALGVASEVAFAWPS